MLSGVRNAERIVILRDPGLTQRIETLRALNSEVMVMRHAGGASVKTHVEGASANYM